MSREELKMGVVSYVKEEIQVIRERDPAIKSNMEVFLYPSFKAILHYRVAHKLYKKGTLCYGALDFSKEQSEKTGKLKIPSGCDHWKRSFY